MTSFGKILRNLRMDRGELLKHMADFLAVSSSFLSAVENGKKKVPDGWVDKIANYYNLSEAAKNELEEAARANVESVKIHFSEVNEQQKDLALRFARKLRTLDDETIKRIQKHMK